MKSLFQKWLLVFVAAAFFITFTASWKIHSVIAENSAADLLQYSLEDAFQRVKHTEYNLKNVVELSNNAALAKARSLAVMVKEKPAILKDPVKLNEIRKKLDVDELHISDEKGILIASIAYAPANGGIQSYNGFDMASTEQSKAFIPACSDPAFELVQSPQPNGILNVLFQYAGVARLDRPGIVQIGYRPERIEEARKLADIANIESGLRIGMNGKLTIKPNPGHPVDYRRKIKTKNGISLSIVCGEYLLTAELPRAEMYMSRNSVIQILIAGNLVLFGVIFILISNLLQRVVINGIYSVNNTLQEITQGNLNKEVKVATTTEFQSLSAGINTTVSALKKAIEKEAKRLDSELEMGRVIQTSVLPTDVPDHERFRIYAAMYTAREVGGDFYDFFTIDEYRTAVLVADVSGKGITAALYMMTAKTLLKELVRKYPPEEAFHLANQQLCRNNKAHMFLTAFLAVLDTRTGQLQCVNAGHNPPLLKHADGKTEYLKFKPSLVLSVSGKAKYNPVSVQLLPGDKLCLYTDGITEAMNPGNELFGEKRLQEAVFAENGSIREIVETIRNKTMEFAGTAPQSDDITILLLEYRGQ